ncbi:NADH-quinone oxidoreductase subunit NuoN [Xanthomonadaceae bacterium JHOS43]|nr:NADH-quinone oxidoreductase subunit NuoN [Xanthomonadaceae bacterium JHOS43]
MITSADFLPLVPEIFLLCATCALLLTDLFVSQERRGFIHFLALAILAVAAILTLRGVPGVPLPVRVFSGTFQRDAAGDLLKLFVYLVTAASFVYAKPYLKDRGLFKGEFYMLCLFAVLGMMLMVSAGNLVVVYLGLELLALSSYALVALDRDNRLASEAAVKYFVLGALASGMLLYGMSMLYGVAGTLDMAQIHEAVGATTGEQRTLLLFGVVFIVVGVAFKFGAAPFHMWLPDVYQGAPTAITLFIGSAPKLAALGMAYRLFDNGVGGLEADWRVALAWLAVLSLVIGNLVAIMQTNLKRMLAYSTISHVGFLFMALANGTPDGYAAAALYTICYALMSAGSFAAIILMSRQGFEAEEISDYRGLFRTHPWFALMILLLMASLAGIPPLFGFWAKLAVIHAALDAQLLWLAVVAVVFAVIGAFYYLRVIKVMFFDPPSDDVRIEPRTDAQLRWVFSANALAMLVLGLFWSPLLEMCLAAFKG